MKIFAISDLHLSFSEDKPMDIFGSTWENYTEILADNWQTLIKKEDVVLIPGDISWAMKLENTVNDFEYINKLNGKKIILKGNHDYWWQSYGKVKEFLPDNIFALQNNCISIDNLKVCGTRGWVFPEQGGVPNTEDEKILNREKERLKLSLKEMQKIRSENDIVIAMMHFPPFNNKWENSFFTDILNEYNIKILVYGHIHGKNSNYKKIIKKDNLQCHICSCDLIDNKPIFLTEI